MNKSVKNEFVKARFFLVLANNSRSKKNKTPTHRVVDIGK